MLIYQINTKVRFNIFDLEFYRSFRFNLDKKRSIIIVLTIMVLVHVFFLNLGTSIFLFHLGILSTLYNVPEKPLGKISLPLRSIPLLKIFLIAYVWAAIASFLPSEVEQMSLFTSTNMVLFMAHFMFILAITLPFDIRDYDADHQAHLITLPQILGFFATKVLALVCLVIFAILIHRNIDLLYLAFLVGITALFIVNTSRKKRALYYTFYLDGTIILYFIAIILSVK